MGQDSALLDSIEVKVEANKRISFDEGVALFKVQDLARLGQIANKIRHRKNGKHAYYIINHHIDYSNICVLTDKCKFCAFAKKEEDPDGFFHSMDYYREKLTTALQEGITEVHIVGGLHPKLPFSYYTDMCAAIRQTCPHLHIKAFTAIEIIHFTRIAKPRLSIAEVLAKLRDAGLGSMPGGGAEIFDERVHDEAFRRPGDISLFRLSDHVTD